MHQMFSQRSVGVTSEAETTEGLAEVMLLYMIHEHWAPGDRMELTSPKSAKHIFK